MGAVSAKSARERCREDPGDTRAAVADESGRKNSSRFPTPRPHQKARGLAKKMFNPTLAQAILDPENLTKLMG